MMGTVWGVVGGKFVVTAAGLLIASRIDQGRVQALVDPQAKISVISREFAEQRHLAGGSNAKETINRRALNIGIGGKGFDQARLAIGQTSGPAGIALVIGRDILGTHLFALDMKRHEMTLLDQGDVASLAGHYTPVPLSLNGRGQMLVPATVNGLRTQAAINVGQADPLEVGSGLWQALPSKRSEQAQIEIGHVRLNAPFGSAQTADAGSVDLGLDAFGGRTIVLDLPHDTLWIGNMADDR